jgi:hypothetical protein
MADEVDPVDDLYGLPLDRFVAERDALAKRLRADGRRAEADEVKALRRPSVAAWAVNQVIRSQARAARALWDAGDALIAAQDALLAGRGDAGALRAASEGEREALDGLVHAARGLLTGEGRDLGEATIERVRETLHAAAIDPGSREDVAAGRATKERAHAGLGAFGGALAPESPAKAPPKPARTRAAKTAEPPKRATDADRGEDRRRAEADERAQAERHAREDAERRERERREAARRRAAAERELRDAQRIVAGAERRAGRAQERLAEAQAAAEEAGAELNAAREREAAARAALEDARGGEKRA